MKPLILNDDDVMPLSPTTMTIEEIRVGEDRVIQMGWYSDPLLEGEGILLTLRNVVKLSRWLSTFLEEQGT